MTDQRLNPDLIHDIPNVLDRHGYTRADDEHTGRAILLIGDLAHIYEGAQDHPFGPTATRPRRPGQNLSHPNHAPRTPSPSRQARSRPSCPRWTPRPTTSATASRPAPTAPANPVPPASLACCTPGPTTVSPVTSSRRPKPRSPLPRSTSSRPARPNPEPTGKPANDRHQQAIRRQEPHTRSRQQKTPEYTVVISASDWVKDHFPVAGASLSDALHIGRDRHHDLEPDLEPEP